MYLYIYIYIYAHIHIHIFPGLTITIIIIINTTIVINDIMTHILLHILIISYYLLLHVTYNIPTSRPPGDVPLPAARRLHAIDT